MENVSSLRNAHRKSSGRIPDPSGHSLPARHFLHVTFFFYFSAVKKADDNFLISSPSRLELGYVYLPDGRLYPVDECSFRIWDFGENGVPPTNYHFTFRAGDYQTLLQLKKIIKKQTIRRAGPPNWLWETISFTAANRTWSVHVTALDSSVFYVGWEWEARIHEGLCRFQVNGVPGWGVSEFMYRNTTGRPEEYVRRDPEWTRLSLKKD